MKKEGFNMKFYEYEYTTFNGEAKTLKLRLVSSDMKTIERATKTKLLDYVSDYSITAITNLLRYMSRPAIPNFSEKDAESLYDELVDSGLTIENIVQDVIMETLVVSGFMKKEELNEVKENAKERKKEKLEERKNPSMD